MSGRSPVRKTVWLLAAILSVLSAMVLVRAQADVGYVRDEGIYLEASRHYGAWLGRVVREPGKANEAKVRDRYFEINHEHPALMKMAAGLSARTFARPPAKGTFPDKDDRSAGEGGRLPWLREGTAMRLPAILLAGLGVFLLVVAAGRRWGPQAGALAAGVFILAPRVFFHAQLHAFDVPVAVMTLAVALAYLRGLEDWRWGLALGPLLGVAIAVKHNALFLPVVLGLHYLGALALAWWRDGVRPRPGQLVPLPFVSMALLGPLTAIALWPWLWTDPVGRLGDYFAFHREHAYYNMEFLGHNYNRPPLPMTYPLVMTWATVSTALLVLALLGLGFALARSLQSVEPVADEPPPRSWTSPLAGAPRELLAFSILAVFPLALIALPTIPIFGGTKHWLTAYPFFGLLAAHALVTLLAAVEDRLPAHASSVAVVVLLLPSALTCLRGHPHGLSQYTAFPGPGGAPGAAELGLNRGFWGYGVGPLLDEPGELRGPVFLHDLHELCRRQYAREGRLPEGWKRSNARSARTLLYFPEKHMEVDRVEIWNATGTTAPARVLELDGVPVTEVYARPRKDR